MAGMQQVLSKGFGRACNVDFLHPNCRYADYVAAFDLGLDKKLGQCPFSSCFPRWH